MMNPPEVSFECLWLNPVLKKSISNELVKMFNGMPVIYEWIEWIKDSCWDLLRVTNSSTIPLDDLSFEDFNHLYIFDRTERENFFRKTEHSCLVCFDELPGTDFVLLPECQHQFCKNCIGYICLLNVKEGTLANLKCPEEKCDEEIPVSVLRSALPQELFERWGKLAFSQGLSKIPDLQFCPRCEAASIQDPGSLGRCVYCEFVFCIICRGKWHAGEPCFEIDADGNVVEEEHDPSNSAKKPKVNWKDFAYLNSTSKRCPNCGSPITKISGCNHVVCAICQTHMCWICGNKIQSYSHFQESPSCGKSIDLRREVKEGEKVFQEFMKRIEDDDKLFSFYCACGERNYQIHFAVNYANCIACYKNICFCCCRSFNQTFQSHYAAVENKYCYARNPEYKF